MSYYTLADFKNLLFGGASVDVDISIKNLLNDLSRKLVTNDNDDTNYQKIKRCNDEQHNRVKHNKTQECDADWNTMRNFKTTVIEKKQGIEKKINEIRTALNKFSVKNKDEQTIKITNLIEEVINEDNVDNEENMNLIIGFIFNIASSNAFFSEIYAELYMILMNKYSVFGSKITDLVENYKKSFNQINPVDPNDDYDGYCGFVKENDNRKAMTTFMCHLTKYNALDGNTLLSITDYIIDLLPGVAENNNVTSVVDEYSDNLYIIITTAYKLFANNTSFQTETVEKLREISQLRKNDSVRYKSMSSRATFKIMDLLDYIKKH